MASRKLEVEILGDSRSLERAYGRSTSAGSKFGSGLKNLGTIAAVGVGAVFVGLAATLKVGFGEMSEGQKVTAQTGAVLKSTGKSANVTAKEVEGLAGSLSRMSGVDDEAIQAGENMLLTFTKIRNEVGKGNDVFDQSTKAVLDLSVALGKDMQSSALMVGKALNDPIKGMSALGRAGVQFSADQKKAIAAMVETGDIAGAQKIILAELNKQFGGSAKAAGDTLPGQLSKLKNAFEESAGAIVQTLIPYLTQLADWTVKHMPEIQATIQTALNAVVVSIEFLAPIIAKLIGWFQKLAEFAQRHWDEVQAVADRVLKWYQGTLAPAIETVLNGLTAFWERFGGAITKITENSLGIILRIVTMVLGNVASVANGIMAIFRGDFGKAWDEISEIPGRMLGAALDVLRGLISSWKTVATAIGGAVLDGMVAGLKGLGNALWGLAKGAGGMFVDGIKAGLSALGGALESAVKAPLNALIRAWNALGIPGFKISIPLAPDINFPGISLPDLPQLAKGGIVTRPTLALMAERNRPEAVIPLDSARGRGILGGGGGGLTVNVYVGGSVTTARDLAYEVRDILERGGKRNGGGMLPSAA